MKSISVVILTFVALPISTQAGNTLKEARASLKKFGARVGGYLGDKASSAAGGYFQLGSHDEPRAYEAVSDFVDSYSKNLPVQKDTGKPAVLMHCLDLSSDHKFDDLILKQDRYVSR